MTFRLFLYFEQLCEDGYGRYHEGKWSDIEDGSGLPLSVSDYVINKYPVGYNIIPRVINKKWKEIDKKTLRVIKYKLVKDE